MQNAQTTGDDLISVLRSILRGPGLMYRQHTLRWILVEKRMDSTASLSLMTYSLPLHHHLRTKFPSHFCPRPVVLPEIRKHYSISIFSSSPPHQQPPPVTRHYCSPPAQSKSVLVPNDVESEAITIQPADQHKPLLQVVLFSPQIPGNTGCIARTCAASAVRLHLVEPLGFQVDDTKLKRAGLDYWPFVVVKIHGSWAEFRDYFRNQDGEKRLLAFTKRGTTTHSDFSYRRGDWLVFGSETSGLPPEALVDCTSGSFGGGALRIPMVETYVRCLNLSVSVGIALYEASRQLNYEQLQFLSEGGSDSEGLFISEDIFA